jgi:cell division protein FtsB
LAKYFEHYVQTDSIVDMAMDVSINLLPNVLSSKGVTARFKLWSCKMFRKRISTASQVKDLQAANDQLQVTNDELQDENAALKEQIAKLLTSNGKRKSIKNVNLTLVGGSIWERVKERNVNRKQGKEYVGRSHFWLRYSNDYWLHVR